MLASHFVLPLCLIVGLITLTVVVRAIRTRAFVFKTIRRFKPPVPPGAGASPAARHETRFSGERLSRRERKIYGSLVRGILLPFVNKPVVVHVGNSGGVVPGAGEFSVFIDCGLVQTKCLPTPRTIWGHERDPEDDAQSFAYSGQGMPLTDDAGFILVEAHQDALYMLFSPRRFGLWDGANIFARVLSMAASEIARPADQARSRQRFADVCWRAAQRNLDRRDARAKSTDEVARLCQQLNDEARASQQAAIKLTCQMESELGREYELLCQVKKVRAVNVTDESIEVHTDVLYCTDPKNGAVYEMGAFEITIPFDAGDDVIWNNKTRQVEGPRSGMKALHVYSNGKACLGNTKSWFNQLIKERKFADAAKLAIAFVETVNPDDRLAYKYLHNWPRRF